MSIAKRKTSQSEAESQMLRANDGCLGKKKRTRMLNLAFLSACQTSKGDVHLTAGMLAVGYRGVVGTMWNISDMHGPEFATEFYQYLLREKKGLDSTRAAYALDYATRKVRESLKTNETALLTWVPYVHFGY
ncbi:hypothetical protein BYT27DRAFT_7258942 [Phlegmacium glaucopus]|nr:hypothetical protein BYT27DRAFT_7258942 [Phlegmacium glaucopus]